MKRQKNVKPFSNSPLGKTVAAIAQFPHRPSELVGMEGTAVEKLLFDIEVLTHSPIFENIEPLSTRERILKRRKQLGLV